MPMLGYDNEDWKQFIHYLGEASKHINKKEIKRLKREEGENYADAQWCDPLEVLLDLTKSYLN